MKGRSAGRRFRRPGVRFALGLVSLAFLLAGMTTPAGVTPLAEAATSWAQTSTGPSAGILAGPAAIPTLVPVCPCITGFDVTPAGDGVSVTIKTAVPAYIWLAISTDQPKHPNPKSESDFMDMYNSVSFVEVVAAKSTSHTFQVTSLKPATAYSVEAMAVNETGSNVKLSSFTSLHRNIAWRIHRIHIIDDSDDLSAGDLAFAFRLQTPTRTITSDTLFFEKDSGDDIEVDDTEPPFVIVTSKDDTSVSATVTAFGVDDDSWDIGCWPLGGIPRFWCGLDREGGGVSADGLFNCGSDGRDGACASASPGNLFDGPSGGGSVQNLNLQSSGHKLSYQVISTITVFFTAS